VRRLSIVVALVFAAACAAGRGTSASPRPAASPAATTSAATGGAAQDPSRLTLEQITAAKLPTAYDLVDRLRRPWLRIDATTGGDVVVYMDEQNLGGASALRSIQSVDVAELDYLSNADAVRRWGAEIKGSVILVVRRR
jgi:hypothetical protein